MSLDEFMTNEELIAAARDTNYRGVMQHMRSWEEIDALLIEFADKLESLTNKQPIPKTNIINNKCTHSKFAVKAKVDKQLDIVRSQSQLIQIEPKDPKYIVKMSVQCNECGMPFRFSDAVLDYRNIDGTELSINIFPKSIISPIKVI